MPKFRTMIAGATLAAFALAGCAAQPVGPAEGIGTLAGGVGGALIGSTIGGGAGRVAAIAAGTIIGGFLGNRIGASIDDDAQQRAYAAQVAAAQSGGHVVWASPHGYNGYVDAGPVTYGPSGTCRSY